MSEEAGTNANQTPFWPGEYTFCPMCGSELVDGVRGGAPRKLCEHCGWIHFRNPGVGAAVVVRDDDGRVLLVKRGPGSTMAGRWCIPAGYVDYGEEVREAAARELREETGLLAGIGDVVFVRSNFHDHAKLTVGIWFEGYVLGGVLQAGDDAVDVGWFDLSDLPPLAFDTDIEFLDSLSAEESDSGG